MVAYPRCPGQRAMGDATEIECGVAVEGAEIRYHERRLLHGARQRRAPDVFHPAASLYSNTITRPLCYEPVDQLCVLFSYMARPSQQYRHHIEEQSRMPTSTEWRFRDSINAHGPRPNLMAISEIADSAQRPQPYDERDVAIEIIACESAVLCFRHRYAAKDAMRRD